jgi:hypothetical protein
VCSSDLVLLRAAFLLLAYILLTHNTSQTSFV